MMVKLKQLVSGMATLVPGFSRFSGRGTGGTDSARYCYSVWLCHLVTAGASGLDTNPKVVAELGPGDSLGTGLAALLSGAEKYYAFDVVRHAHTGRNLKIFDELLMLFRAQADIPGDSEFPNVKPYLDCYDFPADILTRERLDRALHESKVERIRSAVTNPGSPDSMIQYRVPWFDWGVINEASVDLIYSQAVLEYVEELNSAYAMMRLWLKPTGFISHQIDFKSHGLSDKWNGHWTFSEFLWKLVRGNRPFAINRMPRSAHIQALKAAGFRIASEKKITVPSAVTRRQLAGRFRGMSEDDLTTSGTLIQAVPNNYT